MPGEGGTFKVQAAETVATFLYLVADKYQDCQV